ncbi:hypothetical protein [Paractinoplanes durhamensis]|uniref:YokE-like PH domain-containing protein n=1 Tax=Paractinoplanes durhamensis TaxID=113563 RepID=A0ABQ3YWH6_9ACTN|nr:hypothetical protein [Actinoplanes durhamensis]GIE01918.1 hypothetical protein Adu01nite_32680 [Actinoplanes durhamensis]
MQEKLQTRAFEKAGPILQQGETPIVATRAMVGKFSSGRFSVVAQQGLLTGAGGALLSHDLTKAKKQFVVVTDRRLIFLPQTFMGGPGDKILGEVPRETVTLAETKWGVVSLLRLAFGTEGDGISLTFPRVDKKNAEALAKALG